MTSPLIHRNFSDVISSNNGASRQVIWEDLIDTRSQSLGALETDAQQ